MPKYWYCVPEKNEVGEYTEAEGIKKYPCKRKTQETKQTNQ